MTVMSRETQAQDAPEILYGDLLTFRRPDGEIWRLLVAEDHLISFARNRMSKGYELLRIQRMPVAWDQAQE